MTGSKRHEGRVALITGSAQGIGLATALRLAEEGASLVLNSRSDGETAQTALKQVRETGAEAIFVAADAGKPDQLENLVAAGLKRFSRVDTAIWNASLNFRKPFLEYERSDFEAAHAMNFGGFCDFARLVLPGMKAAGHGRLLATLSSAPFLYQSGFNLSGASKAAIISLIKHLATEFATDGITCNGVGAGLTRTGLAEEFALDNPEVISRDIPIGRMGEPAEVAAAFSYLASAEAAYVTGQILHVNGGRYM